MAKNLLLKDKNGDYVTYENVSSIQMMDTDGNNVTYIEKPVESNGKYLVQVVDPADSKVLKSAYLNTGDVFELPEQPTHERIVFEEWVAPVEIINNSITVGYSDITIGCSYHTISGNTEIDIELTRVTGLSIIIKTQATGTIDWGDGSTDTGSTNGVSHTYADYGEYMISISGVDALSYRIANQSDGSRDYRIKKIRIGNGLSSLGGAFANCVSLTNVTIPSGTTSLSSYCFSYCFSLQTITLPYSMTDIGWYGFQYCYSLSNVVLPYGLSTIGEGSFSSCTALQSIAFPITITSFNSCFNNCSTLKSLYFPSSVSSMGYNTFGGCLTVDTFDFSSLLSVPTLSNTNVFSSCSKIAKMVVPDALYDTWVAATNWSTYADYIYKASEVTE